jgi:hypothetical protein
MSLSFISVPEEVLSEADASEDPAVTVCVSSSKITWPLAGSVSASKVTDVLEALVSVLEELQPVIRREELTMTASAAAMNCFFIFGNLLSI